LLHDHNSILSFEDNDIAIPITVLEELDTFKVGNDTKISKRENAFESLTDWQLNTPFKIGFRLTMDLVADFVL